MSKVIVLVGLPGCGKSTYCINKGISVVSSDGIRKALTGDEATQINPKKIFDIAYSRVLRRASLGQDVILDATNIDRKHRITLLELLDKECYNEDLEKICVVFKTPINECIRRDAARERTVGEKVILRMASKFKQPIYDEGWDKIEYC